MGTFKIDGKLSTTNEISVNGGLLLTTGGQIKTQLNFATGGFARGHSYIINGTDFGGFGFYGDEKSVRYFYVAKDFAAPWMSVSPDGTVTATKFVGSLQGNASSANKLNTNAGSATQPIYFSNGIPMATTYALNKTVPSNAVFTDTKNTAGSTNTSSKIFLIGATSQADNPQTYSHDTVYVDENGRLISDGYVIGRDLPFFRTGYKKGATYTFPKETSKTYYVTLKNNVGFEEQKFYLKTYGNNTQYISLITVNARPYMDATIHGQTLRYNGSEITEIAVYENATSTHNHNVVLKVVTNSTTTTKLDIYSDGDFTLDSTCISNTAPTGTKEASYVPTVNDTIFTTGAAIVGGGLTVSGGINGNLNGNASSATTLKGLTASINELNYIDGATSNIQDQLTENANSISTLTATVSNKVDKVSGKGLSTNDYTTNEKNKLAGIAAGANKTTVDSALSSTSTNPVQNKVVNAAITNAAEVSVGTTQPTSSNVKVWYDTSASTVKTKVKNGNTFTELQGVSGVYVGTGTMPSGYNVQINPAGDATTEFAPSGYGLGENDGRPCNDYDSATQPGFYGVSGSSTLNAPPHGYFYYGSLLVERRSNYIFQTATAWNTGWICRRNYEADAGVWSEWEWENPPMYPGKEYRTTERWDGKPVYVKLFDCGALPNNTTKHTGLTISGTIIDMNAIAKGAPGTYKLPALNEADSGNKVAFWNTNANVYVKTFANGWDTFSLYVTVKYTKN